MPRRHVSLSQNNVSAVEKRGHIARLKACKGKPRVRAVTEEAPKGDDNHFGVYSMYTLADLPIFYEQKAEDLPLTVKKTQKTFCSEKQPNFILKKFGKQKCTTKKCDQCQ